MTSLIDFLFFWLVYIFIIYTLAKGHPCPHNMIYKDQVPNNDSQKIDHMATGHVVYTYLARLSSYLHIDYSCLRFWP